MSDIRFRIAVVGGNQVRRELSVLNRDIQRFSTRANSRMRGFSARTQSAFAGASERLRAFSDRFQGLGNAMRSFAPIVVDAMARSLRAIRNFAIVGGVAFAGVVAASIAKANQFAEAFGRLQAATGRSREELAALSAQARELGRTTSFTAVEVVQLQETFGRSGFSPEEISNLTPTALNVARGGDVETSVSADAIGTALRVFDAQASEAQRFGDVMVRATQLANTNFEGIRQGLVDSAPVFASVGGSLEEAVATAAALADAGFRGSRGGVAARNIVSRLASPTQRQSRRQQRVLRDRGVNLDPTTAFFSGEGDSRRFDIQKTIESLREATSNLAAEDRLAVVKSLVGDEAAGSLVALLNQSPERFAELARELDNANGAAARAAATMESNLGGDIRRLQSAAEGFAISLGTGLQPAIRRIVPQVTALVGNLTKWVEANPQAVAELGRMIEAVVQLGKELAILTANVARFFEAAIPDWLRDSASRFGEQEGQAQIDRIRNQATASAATSGFNEELERRVASGEDRSDVFRSMMDEFTAQLQADVFSNRLVSAATGETQKVVGADPVDSRATEDNTGATERQTRAMEESTRATNRLASAIQTAGSGAGAGAGDGGGETAATP